MLNILPARVAPMNVTQIDPTLQVLEAAEQRDRWWASKRHRVISGVTKANRVTLKNQRELPAGVAADRTPEMGLRWNFKTEGASYGKNRDRTIVDKGNILNKKAVKEKMCSRFHVCFKYVVEYTYSML